jgi:hypothetical protein
MQGREVSRSTVQRKVSDVICQSRLSVRYSFRKSTPKLLSSTPFEIGRYTRVYEQVQPETRLTALRCLAAPEGKLGPTSKRESNHMAGSRPLPSSGTHVLCSSGKRVS